MSATLFPSFPRQVFTEENNDHTYESYTAIVINPVHNEFKIVTGPYLDKKDMYRKLTKKGYIVRKSFESNVWDWMERNAPSNLVAYMMFSTAFSKWKNNNVLGKYYVKLLHDIPQLNREKEKGDPNTTGDKLIDLKKESVDESTEVLTETADDVKRVAAQVETELGLKRARSDEEHEEVLAGLEDRLNQLDFSKYNLSSPSDVQKIKDLVIRDYDDNMGVVKTGYTAAELEMTKPFIAMVYGLPETAVREVQGVTKASVTREYSVVKKEIGKEGPEISLILGRHGQIKGYVDSNSNVYDVNGNELEIYQDDNGHTIDKDKNPLFFENKVYSSIVSSSGDGKVIGFIKGNAAKDKALDFDLDELGEFDSKTGVVVTGPIELAMLKINVNTKVNSTGEESGNYIADPKLINYLYEVTEQREDDTGDFFRLDKEFPYVMIKVYEQTGRNLTKYEMNNAKPKAIKIYSANDVRNIAETTIANPDYDFASNKDDKKVGLNLAIRNIEDRLNNSDVSSREKNELQLNLALIKNELTNEINKETYYHDTLERIVLSGTKRIINLSGIKNSEKFVMNLLNNSDYSQVIDNVIKIINEKDYDYLQSNVSYEKMLEVGNSVISKLNIFYSNYKKALIDNSAKNLDELKNKVGPRSKETTDSVIILLLKNSFNLDSNLKINDLDLQYLGDDFKNIRESLLKHGDEEKSREPVSDEEKKNSKVIAAGERKSTKRAPSGYNYKVGGAYKDAETTVDRNLKANKEYDKTQGYKTVDPEVKAFSSLDVSNPTDKDYVSKNQTKPLDFGNINTSIDNILDNEDLLSGFDEAFVNDGADIAASTDVTGSEKDLVTQGTVIPTRGTFLEDKTEAELNPKLFDGISLKEDVRKALLEIAIKFAKYVNSPFSPVDIYFTGSCANYNYNDASDIDLHLVYDYEEAGVNENIFSKFLIEAKNNFNRKYKIKIKGTPVELGYENVAKPLASTGVYSLLNDKWVVEPKYKDVEYQGVDDTLYGDIVAKIREILTTGDTELMRELIHFLSEVRKASLAKSGEFGIGNLLFKKLRADGYLDLLRTIYYDMESKELSLEGVENERS